MQGPPVAARDAGAVQLQLQALLQEAKRSTGSLKDPREASSNEFGARIGSAMLTTGCV